MDRIAPQTNSRVKTSAFPAVRPRLSVSLILLFYGCGISANAADSVYGSEKAISLNAAGAHSIVAADLDGDGDPDPIAALEGVHKVVWYENQLADSGTFGPEQTITRFALGAVTVFAADIDGDDDMDVLSASHGDHKVAWYENLDGEGNFGPQRVISTDNLYSRGLFAIDFDGDRDIDVLSAADEVVWFENLDGKGNFGPLRPISVDAPSSAAAWACDLDGDDDADALAVSVPANLVEWYENLDGEGNFGPSQPISNAAVGAYAVVCADIDNDGDHDVLSASLGDWTVEWFENDGSGNFSEGNIITTNSHAAHGVYAADADGDGDLDVFCASVKDFKLAWYENLDGEGTFSSERILTTAAVGSASPFVADLEGDGDNDILLASGHIFDTNVEHDDKVVWYENRLSEKPFEITSIAFEGTTNHVRIMWNSRPGKVYLVEVSSDQKTWEDLPETVQSGGWRTTFVDEDPGTGGERYYRVREWEPW